jgi:PncC family amidohydrolase
VFPRDDDTLAATIGDLLVARDAMLAVVETSAGGLIAARLLSVPGASRWFERGVIAYSAEAKAAIAPRAAELITAHGAVSAEFVEELVLRMRKQSGAAYAVAESGVAGPVGSHRSSKPPGSVVIGVASASSARVTSHVLPGRRLEVMQHIAQQALEELHGLLESETA